MNRLFTIIILLTGILTTNLLAQPWDYDFGTGTGSFNTASSTNGFLPDPPTNGGSDQVYVGDAGGGFALVNPGSDSELQITAPTNAASGSINKFSVYDYTPGTSFSIGFNIRFECDASDNGRGYFFIGDGDYFTDDVRWSTASLANLYTGIRWRKEVGNSFLFTEILNEAGDNYADISEDFSLNTEYFVEIFGNNTAFSINYDYNGTQTLSAHSYDIWIDGTLTTVDNRTRSLNTMDNSDPITSFMILAEGSTDNNLVVIVDDFKYSNQVEDGPLPVELSLFTAKYITGNVKLEWRTETEVSNYGFDLERKGKDSNDWTKIGFIEGHGNTNSPKSYSFMDENPAGGQHIKYRLKQIDTDGKYEYSDVVEVLLIADDFTLSQNFPNPFNPVTKISYQVQTKSYAKLVIYDILGREAAQLINEEKEAGNYEIEFNASNLNSGTYFYQMRIGDIVQTKKMILLK